MRFTVPLAAEDIVLRREAFFCSVPPHTGGLSPVPPQGANDMNPRRTSRPSLMVNRMRAQALAGADQLTETVPVPQQALATQAYVSMARKPSFFLPAR